MITFLLYILFFFSQVHGSGLYKQVPSEDYFDEGLEYLERGNWEEALNLWIDVRDSLRANKAQNHGII